METELLFEFTTIHRDLITKTTINEMRQIHLNIRSSLYTDEACSENEVPNLRIQFIKYSCDFLGLELPLSKCQIVECKIIFSMPWQLPINLEKYIVIIEDVGSRGVIIQNTCHL